MNRLLIKDNESSAKDLQLADKKCAPLSTRPGGNAISLNLWTLVLLSAMSSSAFANRPSVDESLERDEASEQSLEQDSPSSVEIMMQQQSQQTGDVLQLPATELQPGETVRIKLLDFPRRGMSMQKVQNEYGQPIAISDSVGKPPITRWTYQDRVVYFEYSNVIHVVAR